VFAIKEGKINYGIHAERTTWTNYWEIGIDSLEEIELIDEEDLFLKKFTYKFVDYFDSFPIRFERLI